MYSDDVTDDWSAAADEQIDTVLALRRAIHAEPEIGLHCPLTTEKAKAALAGLPLEIRDSSSTTGFVAILRGQRGDNGRTVLLRGDMDALPMTEETGLPFSSRIDGRMHACGHDAHTAMLVGAARALSAQRDRLPGNVVFMFQPGEEGYHGARFMIDDGLFADPAPDAAFALHIDPELASGKIASRPGPILASVNTIHARIMGRGGHAAYPHANIDPIPIAAEIITALQVFVSRRVPALDPGVLTITDVQGGVGVHNITVDAIELLGTLRALSEQTRVLLIEGFEQIVTGIASAHGAEATAWIDEGYPGTVCDPRAVEVFHRCATAIGGDGTFVEMKAPLMAGEDFSYVLRETPGAFAYLGVASPGGDPASNAPLHNTRMVIDESAMTRGIAMHCAVAERFLRQGFAQD